MYDQAADFGEARSLDPRGSFPATAWKLDVSLPIRDNEMLLDISIINVNTASFNQLIGETGGNPLSIANKIQNIVSLRGKLHNPVTETGGTVCGKVRVIGRKHPAIKHLAAGANISILISSKFIPMVIDRIISVNMKTGQLEVEGYAIIPERCMYAEIPSDIPTHIYQGIINEAGQCFEAALKCRHNVNALVIGSSSNTGLLTMFAVREKLGKSGRLIAVTNAGEDADTIRNLKVADECYYLDTTDKLKAYYELKRLTDGIDIDYTIDCESEAEHEVLSILITRENGTVYFTDPAASVSEASLGAEGIGKDMSLYYYRGYINGHIDFCENLYRKYPLLKDAFAVKYEDRSSVCYLSEASKSESPVYEQIVINSPSMKEIGNIVQHIAPYDTTVLITGTSGSGKEVIADLIRKLSRRNNQKYIKINCAAISDSLFEAEFFGYEKGAFTGALSSGKAGYFESANNGTLFLDEIGELSLENQVKLLRVLQNNEVIRVGSSRPVKVDVRVIAATNRDLYSMVSQGTFREDLYYRINVVNIHLPALKNRREDIRPFIEHFTDIYNHRFGMDKHFTDDATALLIAYDWPGNVRELENMVQRLMLYSESSSISEIEVLRIFPGIKKSVETVTAEAEAKNGRVTKLYATPPRSARKLLFQAIS